MKIFKTLFLLVALLTFTSISSFAQGGGNNGSNYPKDPKFGCINASNGNLHTEYETTVGGFRQYGTLHNVAKNNLNYLNCSPRSTSTTYVTTSISGNCHYYDNGWKVGEYVSYLEVQCPIDDYIPAVVIAMAGAGFFLIRRRDLAL